MIEITLKLELVPIRGWRYEEAFCNQMWFDSRHVEGIDVHKIHATVAAQFGVRPDNKQTFQMRSLAGFEGQDIYLTFHDNNLFVGNGVRPYRGAELRPASYSPKHDPQFDAELGDPNPYNTTGPV